jgi:hypothetical protein
MIDFYCFKWYLMSLFLYFDTFFIKNGIIIFIKLILFLLKMVSGFSNIG